MPTSRGTCHLCEATCGVLIDHEQGRVVGVRGDPQDPLSQGYVCPKALALIDLHQDPDRVLAPARREGERWRDVAWDEALDAAARGIDAVQGRHGRDAVALYAGNPVAHSFTAILYGPLLIQALGSQNVYTANSVDGFPRFLVSWLLYGSTLAIPVPDLERTRLLVIVGANPAVSNGSLLTAPDVRARLAAIRARGGRVVLIDPRRTETAALADLHLAPRPGSDALLLAAVLRQVLAGKPERRHEGPPLAGLERLAPRLDAFTPERVALAVGLPAAAIHDLARELLAAPSAACYGRMGTCVQEHGATATWLLDALNAATGNLDRPGGVMFPAGAADLPGLARRLGLGAGRGRWRSRVRGLPELSRELPVACLAEEIDTPGRGQVRGLVTLAGNPALSTPDGRRLARGLAGLEHMVSIDIYRNETTRHAQVLLPTSFGLEHDHYPLALESLMVHQRARFSPAVLPPPPGVRHDWEVLLELAARVHARRGRRGQAAAAGLRAMHRALPPRRLLGLLLRLGPHRHRASLPRLLRTPQGIDLGLPEPRLAALLRREGRRRVELAPELLLADLDRLEQLRAALEAEAEDPDALRLIGRRQLRGNNSWMHNTPRLQRADRRCTLQVHPLDAARRGIEPGARVRLSSGTGVVEVEAELTEQVRQGVVCLPHGWGHTPAPGARLATAGAAPGASYNDLTSGRVEPLSGCAALSGEPVRLARVDAPVCAGAAPAQLSRPGT